MSHAELIAALRVLAAHDDGTCSQRAYIVAELRKLVEAL
jgi:hypothetical protein